MNEQMKEIKERLNSQMDNLNIPLEKKDRLKRTVGAIFDSQNGRVYLEKKSDFYKYLTIAKNNFTGKYDFCIAKRMINPVSGSIEGRDYQFPGILAISDTIDEYKDMVESEIVNATNYRRMQEPRKENNNNEKTPIEEYTERSKKALEEMTNIPSYKKQRTYDIMDLLSQLPTPKIYSERQAEHSTAIALRETNEGYGYYIVSRMMDEYSGSTIGRDSTWVSPAQLANYVDEHRIELDKEVKRLKSTLQQKVTKNSEKKLSEDDGR